MLKNKFIYIIFVLLVTIFCFDSSAQTSNNDSIMAASYFENEDYGRALKLYLQLFQKDKQNLNVNYKIGCCYLQLNDDKSRAIPFLEYVYTKGGINNPDLLLNIGRAYMYAYNFEDALTFFTEYRRIIYEKRFELLENYYEDCLEGKIDYQKKIPNNNFGVVDRCIENCESAIELFKTPVNVTFEHLGKEINSPYADYNPFVSKDEGTLYFTSRRPSNADDTLSRWETEFQSDVYVSRVKYGEWDTARKFGSFVNTSDDEQCVYVSPDGKNMIISQDNERSRGDLLLVPLDVQSGTPQSFSGPINTQFGEYEGCIVDEGNMVIFSSDRDGGLGESDLYIVKKLPNGRWGLPYNPGAVLNTKYKEAFPIFDEKKNILYFASQGHTNMGGYDIFMSVFDTATQQFETAVNMGYPINSPDDDMLFSLAENGREGYFASVRKEGYGDLDIYKMSFNAIEKRPSVIRGAVSFKEGDSVRKEISAIIAIKDLITNKELDSKKVNFQTGRYIFAVNNPGKYLITLKSDGFKNFEQEINLYDKSDYAFEIENNVVLEKKSVDSLLAKQLAAENVYDSTKTVSLNTLPVNVIVWGYIKTDDTVAMDINATVIVKDAATHQDIIKKNANPKSGKYTYSVMPGKYIMNINSPGYETFSEQINTQEKQDFFATGKNIVLKRTNNSASVSKSAPVVQTTNQSKKIENTNIIKEKILPVEKTASPVLTKEEITPIKTEQTIKDTANASQIIFVDPNQNQETDSVKATDLIKKDNTEKLPVKKATTTPAKKAPSKAPVKTNSKKQPQKSTTKKAAPAKKATTKTKKGNTKFL
ncbi:MAG: hypothetical protein WBM13_15025 [Bacteroidia bacterium]